MLGKTENFSQTTHLKSLYFLKLKQILLQLF